MKYVASRPNPEFVTRYYKRRMPWVFLITFGGNIGWGEEGTEFGGLEIPRTDLLTTAPDTAFVWLNYYF